MTTPNNGLSRIKALDGVGDDAILLLLHLDDMHGTTSSERGDCRYVFYQQLADEMNWDENRVDLAAIQLMDADLVSSTHTLSGKQIKISDKGRVAAQMLRQQPAVRRIEKARRLRGWFVNKIDTVITSVVTSFLTTVVALWLLKRRR